MGWIDSFQNGRKPKIFIFLTKYWLQAQHNLQQNKPNNGKLATNPTAALDTKHFYNNKNKNNNNNNNNSTNSSVNNNINSVVESNPSEARRSGVQEGEEDRQTSHNIVAITTKPEPVVKPTGKKTVIQVGQAAMLKLIRWSDR